MAARRLPDIYDVLVGRHGPRADVLAVPGHVSTAPLKGVHVVLALCARPADDGARLRHLLRVRGSLHACISISWDTQTRLWSLCAESAVENVFRPCLTAEHPFESRFNTDLR